MTGLHEETNEDDLYELFADHGDIKQLHLNLDRRTGYVKASPRAHDRQDRTTHATKLWAARASDTHKLRPSEARVAGLALGLIPISDICSHWRWLALLCARDQGYALIEYGGFKEAQSALSALNGHSLHDQPIVVDWAFKKAPGSGARSHRTSRGPREVRRRE